jgi:hypothetical protein
MVTVLAGIAAFERELILACTGEGRARDMARGVRFGQGLSSLRVNEPKHCAVVPKAKA